MPAGRRRGSPSAPNKTLTSPSSASTPMAGCASCIRESRGTTVSRAEAVTTKSSSAPRAMRSTSTTTPALGTSSPSRRPIPSSTMPWRAKIIGIIALLRMAAYAATRMSPSPTSPNASSRTATPTGTTTSRRTTCSSTTITRASSATTATATSAIHTGARTTTPASVSGSWCSTIRTTTPTGTTAARAWSLRGRCGRRRASSSRTGRVPAYS